MTNGISQLALEVSSCSQRGDQLTNEDRHLVLEDLGLFAVADGLGGGSRGSVAAEAAIDELRRFMTEHEPQLIEARAGERATRKVGDLLRRAFDSCSAAVFEQGLARPERDAIATTLTAVLLADDQAVVAHVGDTRASVVRDGGAEVITREHSVAAELLRRGEITDQAFQGHRLRRALTRSMGRHRGVIVDIASVPLTKGDTLVLTSDGVHDRIGSTELANLAVTSAEALVEAAADKGSVDNATAVVLRVVTSDRSWAEREKELSALSTEAFPRLEFPQLVALLQACSRRRFEEGEVICAIGEAWPGAVFIVDGLAEVRSPHGRTVELEPGSVAGEGALVIAQPAGASLRAKTSLDVLILNEDALAALALRRPHLGVVLYRRLAQKMAGAAV